MYALQQLQTGVYHEEQKHRLSKSRVEIAATAGLKLDITARVRRKRQVYSRSYLFPYSIIMMSIPE